MRISTYNPPGSRLILQRSLTALKRTLRTKQRSSRSQQQSSMNLQRSSRTVLLSPMIKPVTILEDPAKILKFLQRSRILVKDLVQDPKRFYKVLSMILSNMRILDNLCNPTQSCRILPDPRKSRRILIGFSQGMARKLQR